MAVIAEQSTVSSEEIAETDTDTINAGSKNTSNTNTAAVTRNMADDEENGGNGDAPPERVTPAMNRRRVFERAILSHLLACTDEYIANETRVQLNQDITKLQRNWDKFELEHLQVVGEELPVESAYNAKVYIEADGNYCDLMGRLRAKEADFVQAEEAIRVRNVDDANARPVHLTINTPDMLGSIKEVWGKFTGDFAKWRNFRDLFKTGVHMNDKIPTVQKYQLLINALKGDAQRVIGTWMVTEENYLPAWNRLCKTYDDDYLAVQTIVDRLLKFKKLNERTHSELRSLVDLVHECTNQLAGYIDVSGCDAMFLFLAVSKLDGETFGHWETHRQTLNREVEQQGAGAKACVVPPLIKLTDFLETQCRIVMHLQNRDDNAVVTPQLPKNQTSSRESSASRSSRHEWNAPNRQSDRPGKNAGQYTQKYPPCLLCKQNHGLYHCPSFKHMDFAARLKVKEDNNLCEICLKQHAVGRCPRERKDCEACRIRGLAHNTWLCKTREAENRTTLMSTIGNSPEPLSLSTHLTHQPRFDRKRMAEQQGGRSE